jgi:acyl dehydratase
MSATRSFSSVSVGESLEELSIPITRTLIVSGALASRDYQDVHHDSDLAKERGSKDIFMNILTTNGLVGRFLTDWAGPGGFLRRVDIRLGAPNYPDDTMVLSGEVIEVADDGDDPGRGIVSVALKGANSLGNHVQGTASLSLPKEGVR